MSSFRQRQRSRQHLLYRSGFSLLEIIVVVTLLIVLMGLMLPFIRNTSNKAEILKCASNLRALGGKFILYAGDSQGILTMFTYLNGAGSSKPWADFLVEYGYMDRHSDLQLCPSEEPFKYNHRGRIYGTLPGTLPGDPYGMAMQNYSITGNRWIRFSAIDVPSEYWLLADSWGSTFREQSYVIKNSGDQALRLRHGGKANVLFADGHVELMSKEQLKELRYNPIRFGFDHEYNPIRF